MFGSLSICSNNINLSDLEKIHLDSDEINSLYLRIFQSCQVDGLVILSTCNRVEFYFDSQNPIEVKRTIIRLISSKKRVDSVWLTSIFDEKYSNIALEYLYQVASGIKSIIFGEYEILGQIKKAYEFSVANNYTNSTINKYFQSAISLGKKVRSVTTISQGAYSLSTFIQNQTHLFFDDYFKKKILIVGAGAMGEMTLKLFHNLDHPNITLVNRSVEKINSLRSHFKFQSFPISSLSKKINEYDIIVIATASKEYIISTPLERTDPCIVFDLGVPRNVCPSISNENIHVLDLTYLNKLIANSLNSKKKQLPKIEALIEEELSNTEQWLLHKNKLCKTSESELVAQN